MRLASTLLFAAIACMYATAASADDAYPSRAVKIVVPSSPGTAADSVSRFVANRIAHDKNWTVVVENKVGASGTIGMTFAARSPADGYTLLMAPSTLYVNKILQPKLDVDPITDFVPIAKAASAYLVLVVPENSPFKTLNDAVDYMRANPGKLSYASGGNGSLTNLAFVMLAARAGVQATHVPYSGDGALIDTISGQVHMMFGAVGLVRSNLAAGKLRALAVTGPRRSNALPDVPTISEQGYPDYEAVSGLGFMAPKNTPEAVVRQLSLEISAVSNSPEFADHARVQGLEVDGLDSDAYAAQVKNESLKWKKAVVDSGFKID